MYLSCIASESFHEEVGTPCAEGIRLFPGDAHYRVVVEGGVGEVELHVAFVVCVVEVVHPACGVGVDVNDVGVEEVPGSGERSRDGLADDFAVVVDPGCVFADDDLFVGDGVVGVEVAFFGVEAVFALGCHDVVVDFVAVVHLACVEHLCAVDGVCDVDALDGAVFIFVGFAPWDVLAPVEVGCDGVAFLVFFYFVCFVAAVGGVCQALADDAVAHPVDELPVLCVAYLVLVHPESVDADVSQWELCAPEGVVFLEADLE